MHAVQLFGILIADRQRMDGYARALREAIKPGSVVLDLGTGTGIMALLACQCGARRVYAIDTVDVIEVARAAAAANGFADRIEFIQERSTRVTLPERADVMVSDLRGVLPPFHTHLATLLDARRRLLVPDCVLIPLRDTMRAAPVEATRDFSRLFEGYEPNPYGLDLSAVAPYVVNTLQRAHFTRQQLLAQPEYLATFDYATLTEPNVRGNLRWTIARTGTGHGFSVWFDAQLTENVRFSTEPGELANKECIYGTPFFPWPEPVPLAAGDEVEVALRADLVGEQYIWSWDTRILHLSAPARGLVAFRQSTLHGALINLARQRKLATSYRPASTLEGEIDSLILKLMDGYHSVGEIALKLREQFPVQFLNERDALSRVGRLSAQYSA